MIKYYSISNLRHLCFVEFSTNLYSVSVDFLINANSNPSLHRQTCSSIYNTLKNINKEYALSCTSIFAISLLKKKSLIY